ncbi:hypothetical protein ACLOJK_035146 [Asimina triloba]
MDPDPQLQRLRPLALAKPISPICSTPQQPYDPSAPCHPTLSSINGTTNSKGSTLSKSAPMIAAIPSPNRDQSAVMGQVGSKPKSPGIILFIRTNLAWPDRSSWNSSESCWAAMHPATIHPSATHQASDQRPPAVQPPIHDRTHTSDRPIEHAARQKLQI